MKAIIVNQTGGPEALEYSTTSAPSPTEDQVLVAVDMAGVNYIDTYYREGIYQHPTPFVLGQEGTGHVVSDPNGEFAPGDRVAWDQAFGSYAQQVCVPRERLVRVPESISSEVAASMLLQGITAHYLTHGVYELGPQSSCVITAGAGGVGLIATQMAKRLGAKVYTVVSSDEKEQLSYQAGADHVFRYSEGLAEQIRRHNGGVGVDVVYDGVGKDTFQESLEVVRPRGLVCLFGAASGPVEPIDPQVLNQHGSLYLTRPSLGAWTSRPGEFRQRAQAVVRGIEEGWLHFRVTNCYPLSEAVQAHRDLQDRKTTGSIVLRVKED